jgi:alginate O-acetyltransferase complex protein AlgI
LLRKRFTNYQPGPLALFALGMLTWMLVNVTWVFFRAHSFSKAWSVLGGMFGANASAEPILPTMLITMTLLIVAAIVAAHWWMRRRTLESMLQGVPAIPLSMALGVMAFLIVIAQGTGSAFIYFQF